MFGILGAGLKGMGKVGWMAGKATWEGLGIVTGGHQISGVLGGINNYTRLLVPGAMIAGGALAVGGFNMINAPYSSASPRAAIGYTQGAAMKQPSRSPTMGFRGYDSSGLSFALWNMRKK